MRFKECPSCGKQYEESRSKCPNCGQDVAVMSFGTADEFQDWSAGLKEKEQAAALDRKGASLFWSGNLEEAEKLFRKAIQLNPRLATAHGNLGHILQGRGMYAQAVPWLEKALSLDPYLEGVADALNFCRKAAQEKVAHETTTRLSQPGIKFTRKYTETRDGADGFGSIEFTYEEYESASVERAVEFLKQRGPVEQNYYYVNVKTPRGWVGRDIDGIYKEWEQ